MSKICINNTVLDQYKDGKSINDAISSVFHGEIQDRIKSNNSFAQMTPLQMVMYDAGINKYSKVGDIMNLSNGMYTTTGADSNEWLFPVWVESLVRMDNSEQNILPYVVSRTQSVPTNLIKAPVLNLLDDANKGAYLKARIAEGADLPLARITIGEKAVNLWKHGRATEMTYEVVRRMEIDLFQMTMSGIANDIAYQGFSLAADVLINGDGNANSEPQKIGTTQNAGEITNAEIVGFLMDYWDENHYPADTILTTKEIAKQLSLMIYDTNLSSGASSRVTFDMPQFLGGQNVKVLYSPLAKINKKDAIILFNRDRTMTKYEENGSNIQESQQFIRNQTKLLTISENSGYAITTIGANRYVEVLG